MNQIVLEIFTISLLAAVMIMAWYLNRRITSLKAISQELNPILNNLSAILTRSGSHLESLKNLSRDTKEFLAVQMPKADAVKEDLIFLVDHGEKIAKQLEQFIEQGRGEANNKVHQAQTPVYSQPHPHSAPQNNTRYDNGPKQQFSGYDTNNDMNQNYGSHLQDTQLRQNPYQNTVPGYESYTTHPNFEQPSPSASFQSSPNSVQKPKEVFDPYGEYPAQMMNRQTTNVNQPINVLSSLKKIR